MRKYINILTAVLLSASSIFLYYRDDKYLLLFSMGMGLLALSEMNVNWDQKIHFKKYLPDLNDKRHEISIFGKLAGFLSTASLIVFLLVKNGYGI